MIFWLYKQYHRCSITYPLQRWLRGYLSENKIVLKIIVLW